MWGLKNLQIVQAECFFEASTESAHLEDHTAEWLLSVVVGQFL